MDASQRLALDSAIRQAIGPDLDQVVAEVVRLRRDVTALRQAAGLPTGAEADRAERRARAADLRAEGFSTRSIASMLDVDRNTVAKDLAQMGVPRPEAIRGLDGRVTAGPPPPAA